MHTRGSGPDTSLSGRPDLAQSAVAEHAAHQVHDIDWEGGTMMDVEQQFYRMCILESGHIRSETITMMKAIFLQYMTSSSTVPMLQPVSLLNNLSTTHLTYYLYPESFVSFIPLFLLHIALNKQSFPAIFCDHSRRP